MRLRSRLVPASQPRLCPFLRQGRRGTCGSLRPLSEPTPISEQLGLQPQGGGTQADPRFLGRGPWGSVHPTGLRDRSRTRCPSPPTPPSAPYCSTQPSLPDASDSAHHPSLGRRQKEGLLRAPATHTPLASWDGGLGFTVWGRVGGGGADGRGLSVGGGTGVGKGGDMGNLGSQGLKGDPVGLGVSSRQRRSRVVSPAHSAAVTSASTPSCMPCPQHCRLLRSLENSTGSWGSTKGCGVRLGPGSAPLHIPQSCKVPGACPEPTLKQRIPVDPQPPLHTFPPTLPSFVPTSTPPQAFTHFCICASPSLSSPVSAVPSARTPASAHLSPERRPRTRSRDPSSMSPLFRWPTPTQR